MRIIESEGALRTETAGTARIGGREIPYRAVCAETILGEDAPEASIFSTSYLRTDGADDRPVVFAFNGGPGSASLWLHLGLLGPKRVKLTDPVNPSPLPPYEIEDNPHCPIDVCDVVLIDPPGTGYARLIDPSKAPLYFSVDGDALAIATFIRDWLIRNGRVNSPRFLLGESYGTYRMPFVARELMGGPMASSHRLAAVPVSGMLMLGMALTLHGISPDAPRFPEGVLSLPAYACVNHYLHPEGKPPLAEWKEAAYAFSGAYAGALLLGEAGIDERLEQFTGIPAAQFAAHNHTISPAAFAKSVRAGEGLDVGMYDARYCMRHTDAPCDPVADDPAMGKYTAAFVGTWEACMKKQLGIETDREYRPIDFTVNGQWNFQSASGLTPMACLKQALRRNETMALLFGSGIYDLVTDFGTARHLAKQLEADQRRVFVREYESGHMPYIGEESAALLAADLRSLISGGMI